MMALTHGFMSLAVATLALPVISEYLAPPLVLAAAFVGGIFPDLDLFATHRRTLHYPVGYSALSLIALGGILLTASSTAVLLGVLAGAAALHSLSDVLGGSAERAPWDPVTEFGVYNHALGRWHRPRRLVRYSGAPEDLLLGGVFAAVAAVPASTPPSVDLTIVGLVAVAGGYTLARRRIGTVIGRIGALVPPGVRAALPALRIEEHEGGGTTVTIRPRR
jgi:hypothetical protein